MELTITKNTRKLPAILVAMAMRISRYDAGRFAHWSTFIPGLH
jgi:hypothetical protein